MRGVIAALAVTVVVVSTAACGGGEGTPTATTTLTAAVPSTPTAPPGVRHTGIAAVDAVIDAVESRNMESIVALMRFKSAPCSRALPGHSLACPTGGPEGTMVEAFLHPSCEGVFMVTVGEAEDLVRSEVPAARPSVFSVYRTTPQSAFGTDSHPHVDYAVMLTSDLGVGPRGWRY